MNKSDKIRYYGQKDYRELIEFPVELVGKDGVVRSYSYEESLLVYAKRIESAHLRYNDQEVVAAEVDHCYKRIEQLKRSWRFLNARRGGLPTDDLARAEETAAAECRSFIREYFGRELANRVTTEEEPIPIYLSLIQHEGPLKVFHVTLASRRGGYLLYAFAFGWQPEGKSEGTGEADARAQYADLVRVLTFGADGEEVERALSVREGKEFGFVLTGCGPGTTPAAITDGETALERAGRSGGEAAVRSVPSGARARVQAHLDDEPTDAEGHYAMAVVLVGEGDLEGALDSLKICLELQPYYLAAYRLLGRLSDLLDVQVDVEPYLLQGTHYFPDDAPIHFHLGLVRALERRYDAALATFARTLQIDPEHAAAEAAAKVVERLRRHGGDPSVALARVRERRAPAKTPTAGLSRGRLATAILALALVCAFVLKVLAPVAGLYALALLMTLLVLDTAPGGESDRSRHGPDRHLPS